MGRLLLTPPPEEKSNSASGNPTSFSHQHTCSVFMLELPLLSGGRLLPALRPMPPPAAFQLKEPRYFFNVILNAFGCCAAVFGPRLQGIVHNLNSV